jgi:hypothetical protein
MSSDSASLHDKISRWVEEQGFPLEMRVRHLLSSSGFDLVQPAYLDQDSGKFRAGADVVGLQSQVSTGPRGLDVRAYSFAVVECKLGGKKPWVVFLQPHQGAPITMVQQLTTAPEDRTVVERLTHPAYRGALETALPADSALLAPPKVGYAVSEFEGNQDRSPPYDAIRQVIDGAIGVCQENKRYFSSPAISSVAVFCAANLVVTGSRLFTCELNSAGKAVIEEADNVVFVDFRGQGQSQRMHYIRLVTPEFLIRSVSALGRDLRAVAALMARVQMDWLTSVKGSAA